MAGASRVPHLTSGARRHFYSLILGRGPLLPAVCGCMRQLIMVAGCVRQPTAASGGLPSPTAVSCHVRQQAGVSSYVHQPAAAPGWPTAGRVQQPIGCVQQPTVAPTAPPLGCNMDSTPASWSWCHTASAAAARFSGASPYRASLSGASAHSASASLCGASPLSASVTSPGASLYSVTLSGACHSTLSISQHAQEVQRPAASGTVDGDKVREGKQLKDVSGVMTDHQVPRNEGPPPPGTRGDNPPPAPSSQTGAVDGPGARQPLTASHEGAAIGTLGPTQRGEKPRVVVLGSGWAACRLVKELDMKQYDVVVISPRNHMVFTPLLASTCVGTLEFRSVAESVRTIQPAISISPRSYFFLANATTLDPAKKEVHCKAIGDTPAEAFPFTVAYDKLVIASGAEASTFGIQGVRQHAFFLREVQDAMGIRRRLLLNLARSDMPGISLEEKRRLLHCVVVGGGPTGVEFSGELSDFIKKDVVKNFTHVKDGIKVTLIEAKEILNTFDVRLREYATRQLRRAGVHLVRGVVKEVYGDHIVLSNGHVVPYGLLVWSTGVGPSSFVRSLPLPRSRSHRIGVDEFLRVIGHEDMYAIGDCSGYAESTGKGELPALAQVAERQGKYLASTLNAMATASTSGSGGTRGRALPPLEPFVYRHLGQMATLGSYKALVDLRSNLRGSQAISLTGFKSWLIWRSAYLTRVISWRNRLYVAVNWATTLLFGRDISRI